MSPIAQAIVVAASTSANRIATLRTRVNVSRAEFDAALNELHIERRVHLYREDNMATLTQADIDGAYMVGDCPRHILYLN